VPVDVEHTDKKRRPHHHGLYCVGQLVSHIVVQVCSILVNDFADLSTGIYGMKAKGQHFQMPKGSDSQSCHQVKSCQM